MNKLIHKFDEFSLWLASRDDLKDASSFVVKTNYKLHNGNQPLEIQPEISSVVYEEEQYFSNSHYYLVKDNIGKIIGSIRAYHWDWKTILPMEKLFGIKTQKIIGLCEDRIQDVWHIGRLAVDTDSLGRSCILILKMLLTQAIFHVCLTRNSLMLAECDNKLYEKIKLLGICSAKIGEPISYLGSETVPVYNTSKKLIDFLWKHKDYLFMNETDCLFRQANKEKLRIFV